LVPGRRNYINSEWLSSSEYALVKDFSRLTKSQPSITVGYDFAFGESVAELKAER
jgi:hypothetical protein